MCFIRLMIVKRMKQCGFAEKTQELKRRTGRTRIQNYFAANSKGEGFLRRRGSGCVKAT